MDIDPLWTLGGWLLGSECMAAAAAKTSSCDFSIKSQTLCLLLGILFIVLLCARPAEQLRMSLACSLPTERILSDSSTPSQSTMKFQPQQSKSSTTPPSSSSASTREFEAGAHEVPSGPNPISNR